MSLKARLIIIMMNSIFIFAFVLPLSVVEMSTLCTTIDNFGNSYSFTSEIGQELNIITGTGTKNIWIRGGNVPLSWPAIAAVKSSTSSLFEGIHPPSLVEFLPRFTLATTKTVKAYCETFFESVLLFMVISLAININVLFSPTVNIQPNKRLLSWLKIGSKTGVDWAHIGAIFSVNIIAGYFSCFNR